MFCGNKILFHGLMAIMAAVQVKSFGINIMIVPEDDPSQVICTLALLSKYFRSGESLSGSVLSMSITSASINIQQNLLRAIHMDRTHPWTVVINNPRAEHPTITAALQEKPQCYFVIVESLENEDLDDTFEDWKSQINWNPMAQFVVYLASVEETDDEMTELMIEILLTFLNKKIYNINVIGQNDENGFFYGKTVFPYHPDNNCGNRVIAIETLDLCDYQEAEQEHNDEEEEYTYDVEENDDGDQGGNEVQDEGEPNIEDEGTVNDEGNDGNEYGEEEIGQVDGPDEEEEKDEPEIIGAEGDKDVIIGDDEEEKNDEMDESINEENAEKEEDVKHTTEQIIEEQEVDEEGVEDEVTEEAEEENLTAKDEKPCTQEGEDVKSVTDQTFEEQEMNEEDIEAEETEEAEEENETVEDEKPVIEEDQIREDTEKEYIQQEANEEEDFIKVSNEDEKATSEETLKKTALNQTEDEIKTEAIITQTIAHAGNDEMEADKSFEESIDSFETTTNEESNEEFKEENNQEYKSTNKVNKNKNKNYSDQANKYQYAVGIPHHKKHNQINLKSNKDKNKNRNIRTVKHNKKKLINSIKFGYTKKSKMSINKKSSKNFYAHNKPFKKLRDNYANISKVSNSYKKTRAPKNRKSLFKASIDSRFSRNKNKILRIKRQDDLDFEEEDTNSESPKYDEPTSQGTMYMEEHFRALFLDKFPRDLSGCTLVAAFRSWEPFIFSLEKPKEKKTDNSNDVTPGEKDDNDDETGDEFGNEAGGDGTVFGEAGDVASGVNVFGDTEIYGHTNADGDYYVGGDGPDGPDGGNNNDFEPDTSQIEADLKLSGIEYKMVQTIAERLHINIDIQVENNNLYQLFQQLIDGDIEMVVGGIDEDPSISQFVSSTIPYYQDDLTWCVARAKRQHNLFNFLASFRVDTWLLTQSCVLLISLTVFFAQRALKIRLTQLKGYVSIVLRLFGVIITTQSMQLKSMPSTLKISLGSAFFMSLMFSNIYQSFLVSTLTTPKSMFQISHIQEIYQHRMSIMGSVENVRHMNKDGEIFKYLREKFQMCYDIEECLKRAANDDHIAVAVSRLHSFYNPRIPRDLLYCFDRDENLYAYLVTMLLPKKFHLLHMINPVIQHVIESGHMQKWSRDLDNKRKIEQETHQVRESAVRSLNLAEVGGSFAFSGFLLLISSFVFLAECWVYRMVTQRRTRLIIVKMLHKQFS